jgi:hypothetical protein
LPETQDPQDLIRHCYAAFNARDIDAALEGTHSDVDWPNAIEGGRLIGHEAVREYWTKQFDIADPRVEPEGFSEDENGRLVVDVYQVVRDLEGKVLNDRRLQHIYTFRDGLIARMDIRELPDTEPSPS